ncbi:MAG: immunoglobulin-like domain-containing protein [Gemmatimonadota bacterium]
MKTTCKLMLSMVALGCGYSADSNRRTADTTIPTSAAAGDSTVRQQADTAGVTLTLDKTDYTPSGAVVMTIGSQRTDTLGYNPCSDRSVERDNGGVWVPHPEPDRMCTMELRLLMPQQTQTAQTALPADLVEGTYRIVLQLRPQSSDSAPGVVRAASLPFRVTRSAR